MSRESVSDLCGYICVTGMHVWEYIHACIHTCVYRQAYTCTCKLEKIMARHHEGESITNNECRKTFQYSTIQYNTLQYYRVSGKCRLWPTRGTIWQRCLQKWLTREQGGRASLWHHPREQRGYQSPEASLQRRTGEAPTCLRGGPSRTDDNEDTHRLTLIKVTSIQGIF